MASVEILHARVQSPADNDGVRKDVHFITSVEDVIYEDGQSLSEKLELLTQLIEESGVESVVEDVAEIKEQLENTPPVAHNSTELTYGGATLTEYGHVKLTDTINESDASLSIGVSPKAVNDAIAATNSTIENTASEINSTIEAAISTINGTIDEKIDSIQSVSVSDTAPETACLWYNTSDTYLGSETV